MLLGDGLGGFTGPTQFQGGPGGSYYSLAVADLNRDGALDVVVSGLQSVSVFLGGGNGSLTFLVDVLVGSAVEGVELADLNGDGLLDMIALDPVAKTVAVGLGKGDGRFFAVTLTTLPTAAFSLAIADLNLDGKLDVVASGSASFFVCPGTGSGSLGAAQLHDLAGFSGSSLVTADVNVDGKLDLVVSNAVFPGDGDGGFRAPVAMMRGTYQAGAAVLDANHDGAPDVLAADVGGTPRLALAMPGTRCTVFSPKVTFQASFTTFNLASGDLNRDGRVDVVVGSYTGGAPGSTYGVLLGDAAFSLLPLQETVAGSDANGWYLTDLNRDGRLDLVSSNPLGTFLGNGDGTFNAKVSSTTNASSGMVLVDLNRDGKLDAVATNLSNHIVIALGDGAGAFGTSQSITIAGAMNLYSLAAGDFNRDGVDDVVVGDQLTGAGTFLAGDGSGGLTPTALGLLAAGASPYNALASDLNRDGKLDLVISTRGTPTLVLLGLGDGTFQPATKYPPSYSATAADVDGDGRVDLVLGDTTATSQWLRGNGVGTFKAGVLLPGLGSTSIAVDQNADGRNDLVSVSQNTKTVTVFYGR